MSARDAFHHFLILLYQVIFLRAALDNLGRGNDQIRIPSANGTRPKMVLGGPLIVSGTPTSDTRQTESVITLV